MEKPVRPDMRKACEKISRNTKEERKKSRNMKEEKKSRNMKRSGSKRWYRWSGDWRSMSVRRGATTRRVLWPRRSCARHEEKEEDCEDQEEDNEDEEREYGILE